jgi:tetratricopeptide (TPR) repeat protein
MFKQWLQQYQEALSQTDHWLEPYRRALFMSPDSSVAHVNWGIQLADEGKLEEAQEKFQKATQLAPTRPEGWMNWGVALVKAGRFEEAQDKFEKAVEIAPTLSRPHMYLGMILLEQGALEKAETLFEKALQLPDANPSEIYATWGITLAKLGQHEKAVPFFEKALDAQPFQASVHFFWGISLLEGRRYEAALNHFEIALQLKPSFPEPLYFQAIVLNRQEQYAQAEERIRDYLRKNPGHAQAQSILGDCLANRGQFEEAIGAYRQALQLNPQSSETLVHLGMALYREGKLQEALAVYEKTASLAPEHPKLLRVWGEALIETGQAELAYQVLQPSKAAHPLLMAQACVALGHWEEAHTLLSASPRGANTSEPVSGLSALRKARCWVELREWDQAESLLSSIHREHRSFGAVLLEALLYARKDQALEGLRLIRPFYRTDPKAAFIRTYYGLFHVWAGLPHEAEKKLRLSTDERVDGMSSENTGGAKAEAILQNPWLGLALVELALAEGSLDEAFALWNPLTPGSGGWNQSGEFVYALLGATLTRKQSQQMGLDDTAEQERLQEKAKSLLEQALRLYPTEPLAWYEWLRFSLASVPTGKNTSLESWQQWPWREWQASLQGMAPWRGDAWWDSQVVQAFVKALAKLDLPTLQALDEEQFAQLLAYLWPDHSQMQLDWCTTQRHQWMQPSDQEFSIHARWWPFA